MDFLKRWIKGLQQKGYRASVLKNTAIETGPSGGGLFGIPGTKGAPEFGLGEAIKGYLGQDRHVLDRNNPAFTKKMYEILDRSDERGVYNPFKGAIGANEQGELYRLPDTKQESTGVYQDKTPSNTAQDIEQTAIDVKKGQQAVEVAKARKAWLEKTANSPAARAGVFSDDERWALHQKNQDFQEAKRTGTLDQFAEKYPDSQTAKSRNWNPRMGRRF